MEVFSHVLSRECGNFLNVRTTDSTHSCLEYVAVGVVILRSASYLFECEVLGRLFTFGLATTFLKISGISLTLSFLTSSAGRDENKRNTTMRRILLFALPLVAIALSSCEKNPGGLSGDDVIPFQDPDLLNALLEVKEINIPIRETIRWSEDIYNVDWDEEPYIIDIDKNRDKQISVNEASSVRGLYLDLDDEGTVNMSGIEYFTNIEYLDARFKKANSLDLSNTTALTVAYIEGNTESINLSNNTELLVLDCSGCYMSSFDISNNKNLMSLSCSENGLTSLDLSNNTELVELYCERNPLTSLDVSNNTKLIVLDCYNSALTSLDISNNTELTHLDCRESLLTSLDISNNTKLSFLSCWNWKHPIESITVSHSQLGTEWLSEALSEFSLLPEIIVK